jgi:TfoX/Sxy family transcriptional regulator of competence genes
VTVAAYYEAPGEVLDDDEELDRWAAEAYRAALAAHRAKPPKRPRGKPPAP